MGSNELKAVPSVSRWYVGGESSEYMVQERSTDLVKDHSGAALQLPQTKGIGQQLLH